MLSFSVCFMLPSRITVRWKLAELVETVECEDRMFDGGLGVASLQNNVVPETIVNEDVVAGHGLLAEELEGALLC